MLCIIVRIPQCQKLQGRRTLIGMRDRQTDRQERNIKRGIRKKRLDKGRRVWNFGRDEWWVRFATVFEYLFAIEVLEINVMLLKSEWNRRRAFKGGGESDTLIRWCGCCCLLEQRTVEGPMNYSS